MPLSFPLGRIVITRTALMELPPEDILFAVRRHAYADWGDTCAEDRAANDLALECGERLLSVYHTDARIKFWIITERDRSATTILLPEDY